MNRNKRRRLAIERAAFKEECEQHVKQIDNKTISNLSRAIASKGSVKRNGKSLSRHRRDEKFGGTFWTGPALDSMKFPKAKRYVNHAHVKTWVKQ